MNENACVDMDASQDWIMDYHKKSLRLSLSSFFSVLLMVQVQRGESLLHSNHRHFISDFIPMICSVSLYPPLYLYLCV